MVNRNAARHLLLVASILLCFFVYMGYRLYGSNETADETTTPPPSQAVDIAALTASGNGRSGGKTGLTAAGDSPVSDKTAVRPPVAAGSLRSPAMAAGENSPDAARTARTAKNNDLSPIPPAAAASQPPSGSIEESMRPAAAAGAITGLVPAPPLTPPAAAAGNDDAASLSPMPAGLLTPPGSGQSSMPQSAAPAGSASAAADAMIPPPAGLRPGANAPEALVPPPASGPAATASLTPPVPAMQPSRADNAPAGRTTPPPAPLPDRPEARSAMATPPAVRSLPGDAPSESLRMYVVRPGDTLSRIAARELGSISLADNIFLLNRDVIPDPDQLMAGVKIRLPVRDAGEPEETAAATPRDRAGDWEMPSSAGADSEQVRVHTVARGETLSSIALRYYGSSSGWRFLYEVNAKTVSNPNRLSVGTELVIPPYGE